ncbi:MAG: hypothetical protein V2A61_04120 [Calditrichota bacterium]
MSAESIQQRVKFLVDKRGQRTHALMPIKDYERLMEDQYDNEIADSRENEETISLEDFKKRVRTKRIPRHT